jgi:CBS domain-containing protein
MKASEIMTTRVTATNENAPCIDLARKILSGFFSGLPVVNSDMKVVGIVSEVDLLKIIAKDPNLLYTANTKDIMNSPAVCVNEDDDVESVVRILIENKFVRVPVVKNGELVGIISRSDILRKYVRDDFIVFDSGS